jgi:hypothetical protein
LESWDRIITNHTLIFEEEVLYVAYHQRELYLSRNRANGAMEMVAKAWRVDHENVVAPAMVEGDLGDDVHAGVTELQADHGDIRLGLLEEITAAETHDEYIYMISFR